MAFVRSLSNRFIRTLRRGFFTILAKGADKGCCDQSL